MKKNKRRTYRIVISIIAWVLTSLASSLAYSFLSGTGWSFGIRFAAGLGLMCAPVSVFLVIVELLKKEKE